MFDWIVEGMRWLIWGLTSASLTLMDVCYDLVKKVASADFLGSPEVWKWYYTLMVFLGVLILVRVFSVFIKFSFDEEFREKVTASHFMNKIIAIGLSIALLPMVVGFISQVSLWGIQNIGMVVGMQSNDKPSTFIITSFMNTNNGEFNENGEWIEGNRITYTLDDVDINEEGEDGYKFFDNIQDLFIVAIIGIAAAIMLIINAVQIGKRMYALVMKILIAPLPISSLIVPGDETFSMWRKMIVSDYFLNYLQTLMMIVIMILSGSRVVQNLGVWVQIIMFIAGLLLLLSGIPELAKIVGGDTSQANVLQQIASFRMATRGIGSSIGNVASSIGNIAGTGAAAGIYGMGRMMGGQSISDMQKQAEDKAQNGFMGGNEVKEDMNNHTLFNQNSKDNNHANIQNESTSGDSSPSLFMNSSNIKSNESPQASNNENPYIHHTKEGSMARNFGDRANEMTGIQGFGARFAANASKHLYQASMQRMQNQKLFKTGGAVMKLGMKNPNRNLHSTGGDSDE